MLHLESPQNGRPKEAVLVIVTGHYPRFVISVLVIDRPFTQIEESQMKTIFARCSVLALALLSPVALFIYADQVGGSGDQKAPATGGNCNQNSKCGSRAELRAT